MFLVFLFSLVVWGFSFWLKSRIPKSKSRIPKSKFRIPKKKSRIPSVFGFWFFFWGGVSVNMVEREMAESAGLVKGTGFVRDFKPKLSRKLKAFMPHTKI